MADRIHLKTINGKTYYYLQKTWREKVDPTHQGKGKGSGKSRVRTKSIYLGTAESVIRKLRQNHLKPVAVKHRSFGFVAAIYHTACEIGLVDLLKAHFPGQCYGVENWLYFMLPMINRLEHATSKEHMGIWALSTVLPDLLKFDSNLLNSNSFWYATENFINEKTLKEKRLKDVDLSNELFVGLDDQLFNDIEEKLTTKLQQQFDLSWDIILYDTTNFFTYFEEPLRSKLAKPGHNKASRHHLKQVGLALCVEKEWGIPLFHRVYRGNSHDSKTFPQVIDDLMKQMKATMGPIHHLVLVMDKGNNSEDNFMQLKNKIQWIGSLVPSHYPELIKIPLSSYIHGFNDWYYYTQKRDVMGINCVLVITYHPPLERKQRQTLSNNIEKLKSKIIDKWNTYKRKPKKVTAGINTIIKASRYGKYITVVYNNGKLIFSLTEQWSNQEVYFGKNIIFSDQVDASPEWVISHYHSKQKIEEGFKLLKDPGLIRWQPMRHWTDTKIRAFAFCAVMSLVLIRVMEYKIAQMGFQMSSAVIKEELTDLREITLCYDDETAQRLISQRSSVQQKLWDLFQLQTYEADLIAFGKEA